jgi:hypothetical protein
MVGLGGGPEKLVSAGLGYRWIQKVGFSNIVVESENSETCRRKRRRSQCRDEDNHPHASREILRLPEQGRASEQRPEGKMGCCRRERESFYTERPTISCKQNLQTSKDRNFKGDEAEGSKQKDGGGQERDFGHESLAHLGREAQRGDKEGEQGRAGLVHQKEFEL